MLTIRGACPGQITVAATGLSLGGPIGFMTGLPGSDPMLAGPCAGDATGLAEPRPVLLTTAAGDGTFVVEPTLGAEFCRGSLQVVDLVSCRLSNRASLGGDKLFVAGGRGGSSGLWTIDVETGEVDFVGDPEGGYTGLTFHTDGALYGIRSAAGGEGGDLDRLDPATAVSELVAEVPATSEAGIGSFRGEIYAYNQFDVFGTVDLADGTFSDFGWLGGDDISGYGLALASTDEELFMVNGDTLFSVDVDALSLNSVGSVGLSGSGRGGAATFHRGELWFAQESGGATLLYRVDLETGEGRYSGLALPTDSIDGMASPNPL